MSSSRTTKGGETSTSGLACDYALISIMSTLKKKKKKKKTPDRRLFRS